MLSAANASTGSETASSPGPSGCVVSEKHAAAGPSDPFSHLSVMSLLDRKKNARAAMKSSSESRK